MLYKVQGPDVAHEYQLAFPLFVLECLLGQGWRNCLTGAQRVSAYISCYITHRFRRRWNTSRRNNFFEPLPSPDVFTSSECYRGAQQSCQARISIQALARYRAVRAPKQMADLCAMKINFQNRAENFEARFEGNGKTGVLFCAQTPWLYSNSSTPMSKQSECVCWHVLALIR